MSGRDNQRAARTTLEENSANAEPSPGSLRSPPSPALRERGYKATPLAATVRSVTADLQRGSQVYEVVEAQVHPASANEYGSWQLFLINRTASAIQQLSPVLAGGGQSLGNPTVLRDITSADTRRSRGPAAGVRLFCFRCQQQRDATGPTSSSIPSRSKKIVV